MDTRQSYPTVVVVARSITGEELEGGINLDLVTVLLESVEFEVLPTLRRVVLVIIKTLFVFTLELCARYSVTKKLSCWGQHVVITFIVAALSQINPLELDRAEIIFAFSIYAMHVATGFFI